jgi:hypothetical protein
MGPNIFQNPRNHFKILKVNSFTYSPGQHGHIAQTPEEKTFRASLSDSVRAESVRV